MVDGQQKIDCIGFFSLNPEEKKLNEFLIVKLIVCFIDNRS